MSVIALPSVVINCSVEVTLEGVGVVGDSWRRNGAAITAIWWGPRSEEIRKVMAIRLSVMGRTRKADLGAGDKKAVRSVAIGRQVSVATQVGAGYIEVTLQALLLMESKSCVGIKQDDYRQRSISSNPKYQQLKACIIRGQGKYSQSKYQ